ncbi:hypothetical protein KIPB_009807 [Kipferlia bialata]|uniref:Uncharacterized protein n=1 Tax=Kipferlia bialata TaxID=797122 RepID=A0A391NPD4_9EUKA|nr:hypothetical protein KIPB_009807 [Kipferlia bialata]|eukprot:g9807.t1
MSRPGDDGPPAKRRPEPDTYVSDKSKSGTLETPTGITAVPEYSMVLGLGLEPFAQKEYPGRIGGSIVTIYGAHCPVTGISWGGDVLVLLEDDTFPETHYWSRIRRADCPRTGPKVGDMVTLAGSSHAELREHSALVIRLYHAMMRGEFEWQRLTTKERAERLKDVKE